jgi:hypothetical protein
LVLCKQRAVARWVGIDADDRLAIEVLGDICHEPRRPDRHDDVGGLEEETIEIGSLDPGSAPVDGGRRGRRHECVALGRVARLDLIDGSTAGLEKNRACSCVP